MRLKKLLKFTQNALEEYVAFHNENNHIKVGKAMLVHWCRKKNIHLIDCSLPEVEKGKVGALTDGSFIAVDFTNVVPLDYYLFWHEYAHLHLHFDSGGQRLSKADKEREADVFAAFMCNHIFPGNYHRFVEFARKNPSLPAVG